MYIRPVHAELDPAVLHAFIQEFPLGLLTTSLHHPTISTLQSTHIPFLIDPPTSTTPAILRAHLARANPQCKSILHTLSLSHSQSPSSSSDNNTLEEEVLVIFTAPVHHYVTPKFYTDTKPKDRKVVPTWNYCGVQVYGKLRAHHQYDGSTSGEFLSKQLKDLANMGEPRMGSEWKVDDAPERYVELLKKGIIGIEIEVDRIEGRFKLSQESGDGDWWGVVNGFRALGTPEGAKMADIIEAQGKGRSHNQPVANGNSEGGGPIS
jgi:transcriptional regulator